MEYTLKDGTMNTYHFFLAVITLIIIIIIISIYKERESQMSGHSQ